MRSLQDKTFCLKQASQDEGNRGNSVGSSHGIPESYPLGAPSEGRNDKKCPNERRMVKNAQNQNTRINGFAYHWIYA